MAKELKKNKAQMVMPESKEDKKKALESAIAHILKTYGSGAVMRLGQANTMQVDAIPTGSMTLDLALGIGGVPRGRIVELYGPEKRLLLSILQPKPRSRAEKLPLLMLNTP